jgi:transglutaminase-like putative cysteine protease
MIYSVRHTTTFRYEPAVRESVMEVRLQPRNDGEQRCLNFILNVDPATNVMQYHDFTGNTVHHFDIAGRHSVVKVTAHSTVEVQSIPAPRPGDAGDWADLDALIEGNDHWEMLLPSHFAHASAQLEHLAKELRCERKGNPLMVLSNLNAAIYNLFDYVPNSTKVDSPIEEALTARQGVCQDFAHIMIALVRSKLRIPCRYVSGYLFHGESDMDRSVSSATHAWIEALIPPLGWVGFDPTNWLVAGDRHIRTAIGRDYADVSPTRGIFRGRAASELTVAVRVIPSQGTPSFDQELPVPEDWSTLVEKATRLPEQPPPPTRQQQMAQQQQSGSDIDLS